MKRLGLFPLPSDPWDTRSGAALCSAVPAVPRRFRQVTRTSCLGSGPRRRRETWKAEKDALGEKGMEKGPGGCTFQPSWWLHFSVMSLCKMGSDQEFHGILSAHIKMSIAHQTFPFTAVEKVQLVIAQLVDASYDFGSLHVISFGVTYTLRPKSPQS